jgi:hypothetical protein
VPESSTPSSRTYPTWCSSSLMATGPARDRRGGRSTATRRPFCSAAPRRPLSNMSSNRPRRSWGRIRRGRQFQPSARLGGRVRRQGGARSQSSASFRRPTASSRSAWR